MAAAYHEGRIKTLKYVDDEVNSNKVNMRIARMLLDSEGHFKEITDLRTQGLLQHKADRTKERGMAINARKTGLMIVSAACSFEARVWLQLDGVTITGSDKLKILGVTMDKDASFSSE